MLALFTAAHTAPAQPSIQIKGDRLSGVVLPIEPTPGEIQLRALSAKTWVVDDTQRLLLEGDVMIDVAGQSFAAATAVVWLNRLPSADGLINQIAIYFDDLRNPTSRPGLSARGESLLVTGSTRGTVTLEAAAVDPSPPVRDQLVRRAEERLAGYIGTLLAGEPKLASRPQVNAPPGEHVFNPMPGGRVEPEDYELPKHIKLPPIDEPQWLRDPTGVVAFSAEHIEVVPGELENTITAVGAIDIEYFSNDGAATLSELQLSAERAVIFTDPDSLEEMAAWSLDANVVRGIYLEGNVQAIANNGEYVLRSPRAFYDFKTGKAVMIDSVLRTDPFVPGPPIYIRANEMRQVAANKWEARGVRVMTSEFHTGHIAVGAGKATVTQRPIDPRDPTAGDRTFVQATNVTLRAEGLPVFYWPIFAGTPGRLPLRNISMGTRDNDGLAIETTWDLFALLGRERPEGLDAELLANGYTSRGGGAGVNFTYDVADAVGKVELFGMYDDGVDRTPAGREIDQDAKLRGHAIAEHQMDLGNHWTLQGQLSYISDETYIAAWREDDYLERREYETSLYFKHQRDRAALTLLGSYQLNDFLSNSYLIASQQYSVEKLPELTYRRYGDPLFGDNVTYSAETRLSRMRIVFDEHSPDELGVRARGFGILPDTPFSEALEMRGLRERYVGRFDTRHEFAMPFESGALDITPFVVGRLTAYDDDFDDYSSESDAMRLFGAAGVRIGTEIQHIDNSIESRLLDLHRLRHVIEPSVTLWYGYASVSQDDLPIYDAEVESLATGAAIEFALRNTWQTQRGGPGRWMSVDVFTLDTAVVLNSDDAERESPTPQFFDYRPEYSQFGDHFRAAALWLVSDAFSISGQATYDLDDSVLARGSIGAALTHNPLLSTYVEYRTIEASDTELLGMGWRYRLTRKYRVDLSPQWDFKEDDFRAVRMRLTRTFPDFDLTVEVRYDQIRDDTLIGARLGVAEF